MKFTTIKFFKLLFVTFLFNLATATSDPFSILGIPTLNPSQIFNESLTEFPAISKAALVTSPLKNIDDLPRFLQQSKLSQEEGLKIISRFLIADDYMLKKFGAVFDQTGFDGLMNLEMVLPKGSKGRHEQRAKSAAKLFVGKNYKESYFDAYGAEKIESPATPQGWEVYRVLLVCKGAQNQHIFMRVCLPLDEMLVPLVTEFNSDCVDKIKYEEETKIKNAPYLEKIKQSNFFSKNIKNGEKNIKIHQNSYMNSPKLNNGQLYQNTMNNFKDNIKNFMNNQMSVIAPPKHLENSNLLQIKYNNQKILSYANQIPNININRDIQMKNDLALSNSFLMKSETKNTNNFNFANNIQNQQIPQIQTEAQKQINIQQQNKNFNNLNKSNILNQVSNQGLSNLTQKNLRGNTQTQNINTPIYHPQIINNPNLNNIQGLEQKIETINEKLNKLESRVEKDEKITLSTREDIKGLKTNLDKNFNKLDMVLEKLAIKLK